MVRGRVAKLQRYATKDGPGLRTTVFLSGCNLRCKWCANPEMLTREGSMFYYPERCHQCGICVQMAKPGTIQLGEVGCVIDRKRVGDLTAIGEACPFEAYEQSGQWMESDELVRKLLRDIEFYEESGGGITFSGGEAGLQADFVCDCASQLKAAGVHVALDTAGHLPSDTLHQFIDVIDLVLYDLKAYDRHIHMECTEVDNTQILENAKQLAASAIPMIIRMIVVPEMNDDPADITARFQFIKSLGDVVQQVDLLPYHNLGEGKYDKLGLTYTLHGLRSVSEEQMNAILHEGKQLGLHVTIGG